MKFVLLLCVAATNVNFDGNPAKKFLLEQSRRALMKLEAVDAEPSLVVAFKDFIDSMLESDSVSERHVNIMSSSIRDMQILNQESVLGNFLSFVFSILEKTGTDVLSSVPSGTIPNQESFHRILRIAVLSNIRSNGKNLGCLLTRSREQLEAIANLAEQYYMEYISIQTQNPDVVIEAFSIDYLIRSCDSPHIRNVSIQHLTEFQRLSRRHPDICFSSSLLFDESVSKNYGDQRKNVVQIIEDLVVDLPWVLSDYGTIAQMVGTAIDTLRGLDTIEEIEGFPTSSIELDFSGRAQHLSALAALDYIRTPSATFQTLKESVLEWLSRVSSFEMMRMVRWLSEQQTRKPSLREQSSRLSTEFGIVCCPNGPQSVLTRQVLHERISHDPRFYIDFSNELTFRPFKQWRLASFRDRRLESYLRALVLADRMMKKPSKQVDFLQRRVTSLIQTINFYLGSSELMNILSVSLSEPLPQIVLETLLQPVHSLPEDYYESIILPMELSLGQEMVSVQHWIDRGLNAIAAMESFILIFDSRDAREFLNTFSTHFMWIVESVSEGKRYRFPQLTVLFESIKTCFESERSPPSSTKLAEFLDRMTSITVES